MRYLFYVYILLCADAPFYIGVANNLDSRLEMHNRGEDPFAYTFGRRPIRLMYYEEYQYIDKAIEREKQLKKWTRAKKIALIQGKENELFKLAKSGDCGHASAGSA